MKTKSPVLSRQPIWLLMVLITLITAALFVPGTAWADANPPPEPTATNVPEPTPIPPTSTIPPPPPPTPTRVPIFSPTPGDLGSMGVESAEPPTSEGGRLSLLNRMLLALLAVVTVVVIGFIVYALYYRTRGSLSER